MVPVSDNNLIYSDTSYGPTFGGGYDIYISDNCSTSNSSYANFPIIITWRAPTNTQAAKPAGLPCVEPPMATISGDRIRGVPGGLPVTVIHHLIIYLIHTAS